MLNSQFGGKIAANYADYANGRIKEFLGAPIRVICVIRGYFPSFSSRYFLNIAFGINA
jgi:hypothetical protein